MSHAAKLTRANPQAFDIRAKKRRIGAGQTLRKTVQIVSHSQPNARIFVPL